MSTRQPIGLHIRKCDLCGTVNTHEGDMSYADRHAVCSGTRDGRACGRRLTLRAVVARVTAHVCGPKCTSAIGPNCDCSCGGRHHGEDHRG